MQPSKRFATGAAGGITTMLQPLRVPEKILRRIKFPAVRQQVAETPGKPLETEASDRWNARLSRIPHIGSNSRGAAQSRTGEGV